MIFDKERLAARRTGRSPVVQALARQAINLKTNNMAAMFTVLPEYFINQQIWKQLN